MMLVQSFDINSRYQSKVKVLLISEHRVFSELVAAISRAFTEVIVCYADYSNRC